MAEARLYGKCNAVLLIACLYETLEHHFMYLEPMRLLPQFRLYILLKFPRILSNLLELFNALLT